MSIESGWREGERKHRWHTDRKGWMMRDEVVVVGRWVMMIILVDAIELSIAIKKDPVCVWTASFFVGRGLGSPL